MANALECKRCNGTGNLMADGFRHETCPKCVDGTRRCDGFHPALPGMAADMVDEDDNGWCAECDAAFAAEGL